MNEAKRRRASAEGPEVSSSSEQAARSAREAPVMDQDDLINENSDHGSSESEEEAEFDDARAQEIFDNWILSLRLDQRQMLAVILMESFKNRQGMKVKDAAQEAGSIVGFNEKTVRKHRNNFFDNKGYLSESRRGKYDRHCIYHDEDMNQKAREWVRVNALKKGAANITATAFCEYVNNHLLPSSHLPPFFPQSVSLRTAIRWLHHLGFKPKSHQKGVYIDGHEREDVVKNTEVSIEDDGRAS